MGYKYKILSFIVCIKLTRKNGFLYSHESDYAASKIFNINYKTFVKYKEICIKKGLFRESKGSLQLLSLNDCLQILNLDLDHCRFFNHHDYDKVNIMAVYEQIKISLLERNFRQQKYAIDKKRAFLTNNSINVAKAAYKKASCAGLSFNQYKQSILAERKHIVTGKFHASSLINMSTGTGSRTITKLKGKYDVKTIFANTGIPAIIETFEHVRGLYKGFIYNNKGFWSVSLGSAISLKNNLATN